MKKSELEAEVKRLTRSAAWYSGAYYRLRESEENLEEQAESLQEQIDALEREFSKAQVKRDKEQAKDYRVRKARQDELLKEQLRLRKDQEAASKVRRATPPDEDDERTNKLIAAVHRYKAEIFELKAQLEAKK